jgi:hypothetical protein
MNMIIEAVRQFALGQERLPAVPDPKRVVREMREDLARALADKSDLRGQDEYSYEHKVKLCRRALNETLEYFGKHLSPGHLEQFGQLINDLDRGSFDLFQDGFRWTFMSMKYVPTPAALSDIRRIAKVVEWDPAPFFHNVFPYTVREFGESPRHMSVYRQILELDGWRGGHINNLISSVRDAIKDDDLFDVLELLAVQAVQYEGNIEAPFEFAVQRFLSSPRSVAALRNAVALSAQTADHNQILKQLGGNQKTLGIAPSLNTLNEQDVLEVMEYLDRKPEELIRRQRELALADVIEPSSLNRFLVAVMSGAFAPDNRFKLGLATVTKRLDNELGRSLPTLLQTDDRDRFIIKASLPETLPYVPIDRSLDRSGIEYLKRALSAPSEGLKWKIIDTLINLSGRSDVGLGQELGVLDHLEEISRHNPTALPKAMRIALPLMSEATRSDLLFSYKTDVDIYRFLSSVDLFLSAHLPERLRFAGIELPPDAMNSLNKVTELTRRELAKFCSGSRSGYAELMLVARNNALDSFYSQIGQTCIEDYNHGGDRDRFQPIRIHDAGTGGLYGIIYAVPAMVRGEKSVILAGVEPKMSLANRVSATELCKRLVEKINDIADRSGCTGGVYTVVGNMEFPKLWTDDGRIAQLPTIQKALMSQAHEIFNLPERERVSFPSGYSRQICRVAKLS